MKRKIKGFIYGQINKPVEFTKPEWKELINNTIADGGWRRSEKKETFIHSKDAKILAEIYEMVYT